MQIVLINHICYSSLEKELFTFYFQIREKLVQINNIDVILNETRGNKTIAAALQSSAETASKRAAEIRYACTIITKYCTFVMRSFDASNNEFDIIKEYNDGSS